MPSTEGGILVNKNGDRFTNEYLGYSELGTHIVNQPDHIAYMIIDAENAKNTPALAGWEAAGIVKKADTPEELAEQLGIPPAKLRAVFDDYVEGIKQGEDRFNRTKLPKEWKPPFYAVEATGDLRHTQGGLVTDTDARVLKTDGEIIPGLYAAGGVTEGFTSAGGPAYMSGNRLATGLRLRKNRWSKRGFAQVVAMAALDGRPPYIDGPLGAEDRLWRSLPLTAPQASSP